MNVFIADQHPQPFAPEDAANCFRGASILRDHFEQVSGIGTLFSNLFLGTFISRVASAFSPNIYFRGPRAAILFVVLCA
jgi:hypothetical protein